MISPANSMNSVLVSRAALTLVEIIVAVALIGLIAAVSIPNALAARISGNDNTAKVVLGNLVTRQEAYKGVENTYWPRSGGPGGVAVASLYDPATAGIFLPGITAPQSYMVFTLAGTHEDSNTERFCMAIQHHRRQSNVWLWTSLSSGEHTRLDRLAIDDFAADAGTACATLIDIAIP
jgi:type II secretory pathway pseudopilin PulG